MPTTSSKNISVLALGPESAGNFSIFHLGEIYSSSDFGDLLDENNFKRFKKAVLDYLKKEKVIPSIILTDLHPLYKTTLWGETLAKKFSAKHIKIQHHLAHIFSAVGENSASKWFGIACDGTGYGLDGKIWGGEVFELSVAGRQLSAVRIGHLENQILIGGDLAIKEPTRMLIAILSKFLDKEDVFGRVKKFYTKNQFELLYNQLRQNFNCQETSSAGRILDAVSVLLGFSDNKRGYKHKPIVLLEENSSKPYADLKPKISQIKNGAKNKRSLKNGNILLTTPLFEYLIKNADKDKKRLAATAQMYIAEGLYEIIQSANPASRTSKQRRIYFAGGVANNKIISSHLESKGVITSKKVARGDAGLSFGQIIYYLRSVGQ